MSVISYPKNVKQQLSDHFWVAEFNCPCADCKATLIHPELVDKLEKLRAHLGSKVVITSGYRCPNYQQQLRLRGFETAKGISTHTQGIAADLTNGVALGAELEEAARKAGFSSVGVGRTWIHCDLRPGMRRWFYSKSR